MHRSRGKIILIFSIPHLSVTQLFAHINLFLLLLSKRYVLTILLYTSNWNLQSEVLKSFCVREGMKFTTVLVDEAAQCMESASMPAIVLGCERLILVG
jgi:AAA domain